MIHKFKNYTWSLEILTNVEQLVPGRVLCIVRDDLNIEHEVWQQRLLEIKSIVEQNNIEKILVNVTMNPELVDKIYNHAYPSPRQCINDLNQICKTYYVTSDYNYYYTPDPCVKFFPAFLWFISTRQVDELFEEPDGRIQKTIYDTQLDKTKAIMCLNRNLMWHRLYLFSLLAEQPWFHKITYSFLNKIENRTDAVCIQEFLNEQQREKINSLDHLLPMRIESEVGKTLKQIPIMWMHGASSVGGPEYRDHAINLVTETSLTEGVILTEKTCKPFMAYQIPIIVGPIGANKFLQDIGFDMFEDYIPWRSWDSETDHHLKIQKIALFLEQLLSSPTTEQDILSMHKKFHSRLIHNKQHFYSRELRDLLASQISNLP
jgi:hypothetical protein